MVQPGTGHQLPWLHPSWGAGHRSYPETVRGGHWEGEGEAERKAWRPTLASPLQEAGCVPALPQSGLSYVYMRSYATQSTLHRTCSLWNLSSVGLGFLPTMFSLFRSWAAQWAQKILAVGGSRELNDQPSPREWPGLRAQKFTLDLSKEVVQHWTLSAYHLQEPQISMTSQGPLRGEVQGPRLTAWTWPQVPSHRPKLTVSASRVLFSS